MWMLLSGIPLPEYDACLRWDDPSHTVKLTNITCERADVLKLRTCTRSSRAESVQLVGFYLCE